MKIQLRGHCQQCGKVHAVTGGTMAKHGYTVDYGFFNGVCGGQHYAPIEQNTSHTEKMIEHMKTEIANNEKLVADLESGTVTPELVYDRRVEMKWSDAPEYLQHLQVKADIAKAKSFIRQMDAYIRYMGDMIEKHHGKPLIEIEKKNAPAPIFPGEKRVMKTGRVIECVDIRGPRVYWKSERKTGWTGSTAWRKLEKA